MHLFTGNCNHRLYIKSGSYQHDITPKHVEKGLKASCLAFTLPSCFLEVP